DRQSTRQSQMLSSPRTCNTTDRRPNRGFGFFFFSSRRRHTRSVSAFLLNRSSDLAKDISNVVTDAASGVVDIFHGIDKAVADTWNNFWKDGKADGIGSNLSRK